MNARRALLACLAAAAMAGAATPVAAVRGGQTEVVPAAQQPEPAVPVTDLPVRQAHRYRMAGRIRPFLFWIGRDDVGIGEIVWRGSEDAVAYELLIGTDATKAPRGINRWGYLLEERKPSGTRVFGVMTTSDEATLSEVTSKKEGQQRTGRFKGIDAHIAAGVIQSTTETLETERDYGIRDKEIIVRRIAARLKDATPRDGPVPDGVRPGFLTAVAELVNEAVVARSGGDQALRRLKGRSVLYTYNRRLYDLELTGIGVIAPAAGAGFGGRPVHADFETTNHSSGNHNTFELEFPTEGPNAGVPTLIRHRPRWWLEAVLTLEVPAAAPEGSPAPPPEKR